LNVTEGKLAANAVTTAKITDLNVTGGKLAVNAVTTGKITDLNVTTGKIADDAVNASKLDPTLKGTAPKSHIYGLKLTKLTAAQIRIEIGVARSDDNTVTMESGSTVTVDMATIGAANGLDVGPEAVDTWYYVFLIYNPTTTTIAGLFSTSSSAPTMPSGYTKKRLLGAVRNDSGSDFLDFYMIGNASTRDVFYRGSETHIVLTTGNSGTFDDIDVSGLVPPISLDALMNFTSPAGKTPTIKVREKGTSFDHDAVIRLGDDTNLERLVKTDSSQVFEYKSLDADTINAYVSGFKLEL